MVGREQPQLARDSGGTTADVTAAASSTGYRTSNPLVATVDAEGLVTAQASGIAIISAVNEGALAILRLQVVLSGSTVGDGIPDDWKVAHGLDPNDPPAAASAAQGVLNSQPRARTDRGNT